MMQKLTYNGLMVCTDIFTQVLGEGPDVVLLHGWGVHSVVWKFVAECLAQNFRVTLVDLPGFGRSNLPIQDYHLDTILPRILRVVPQSAIWIGWSLGGLLATYIAITYPQKVRALIAVASSPRFTKDSNWPGIQPGLLQQFAQQLITDYEATITRFMLLQFHGTRDFKDKFAWLEENLFIHQKPAINVLLGALHMLESLDLRQRLQQLHCKTLFIFGRLDAIVPWEIHNVLKTYHPEIETVLLPKASHALFLSHEREFLHVVVNFLQTVAKHD